MKDLIDRQSAIDAVEFGITYAKAINKSTGEVKELFKEGNKALNEAVERLKELPSAQPEPCEDVVSRNAIVQKLNKMDRYVSEELRLCDTDKKFPKNEVFIVDDVYEEIVEKLPSTQPKIGHWIMTRDYFTGAYESIDYVKCSCCGEDSLEMGDYCPNCGAKMVEPQESEE